MLKLTIPAALNEEFRTVEAVRLSGGETRRVDALILAWVKYEKQLRRLFSFLVFQHPNIGGSQIDKVIEVLAKNGQLYPETFIAGIKGLGVPSIEALLAPRDVELMREIARIKKYRNKLIHGQITGLKIPSRQLERDVAWIVDWVGCLAEGSQRAFGYDGLRRNTYRIAKDAPAIVATYPFETPAELEAWLPTLNPGKRR
jgi:hypothetical protein